MTKHTIGCLAKVLVTRNAIGQGLEGIDSEPSKAYEFQLQHQLGVAGLGREHGLRQHNT